MATRPWITTNNCLAVNAHIRQVYFARLERTVIASRYVGVVSGTYVADVDNDVLCLDVNRISLFKEGGIPIHRPGWRQWSRKRRRRLLAFHNQPRGSRRPWRIL